jgi:parallel beta-helix repeat protein
MNDTRLERLLDDVLADIAAEHVPDRLGRDIGQTSSRVRQRPRWLAFIKEPPMRIHSRVAVGSPTARLAYLFLLTLLLSIVATGAVVAGASLLPGPVIVVAQDGSGTVRTINEAVEMAQDGDTVLVKPGTYLESIAITRDITLRGDGDRGAVILEFAVDGPTHTVAEDGTFAYGMLLDDAEVRVENITVRGPSEGVAFVIDGGAPVIDGVDIVLEGDPWGVDGWYYKRSAIRIQGGSSPVILDSTWDGYTRISGGANSPTFVGNSVSTQIIAMGGSGQKPIIRGNTLLDGASIGWMDPGSSGIVEDNDIVGFMGGYAGDGTIIRGNRIREGYQAGPGERGSAIRLTGSGTAIVEGNDIGDSQYGIDVTGSGGTPHITGNTIRGSAFAAIIVDRGAPTIDGNVLERNATGIEVIGATTTPVLAGNTFCGNGVDLAVPDGSTLTLDGNTICAGAASSP